MAEVDVVESPVSATVRAELAHRGVVDISAVHATASENDTTVLVTSGSGDVVLKMSPDGSSAARMQSALLGAVADRAPELPVPRVLVDDRTGTALDPRGTSFVSTLLPGTPLEDVAVTEELVDTIAVAQAVLLTALEPVDAGAAHVPDTNDWSLDAVGSLAPIVNEYLEQPLRDVALDVISRYRTRIEPELAALPTQVLHADFNLSNLLVQDGALTGIIDFGDAVRAPRIFDVAVTAAYLAMHVGAIDHPLVERYVARIRRLTSLTDAEIALLRTLILCRAVLVLGRGRETASRHPDRAAYQLRYDALAARVLEGAASASHSIHPPHGKKHQ